MKNGASSSASVEVLRKLIGQHTVTSTDEEKVITGKLRPILKSTRKHRKLEWSFQSEASSFKKDTDADPIGHPDIRLTRLDKDNNQYDYDIECKHGPIEKTGKNNGLLFPLC